MNLLCLDFETYYDKDYSLMKMTTEEYIRSPLFEIIGVAVSTNGGEPEWFSGSMDDTALWLRKFDWENNMVLAHNAMFDMSILNWQCGGLRPKRIADTLSMARALHGTEVRGSLAYLAEHYKVGVKGEEVGKAIGKHRGDFTPTELAAYAGYCRNDVSLTVDIFKIMAEGFAASEMELIDLTVRMFSEPKLTINSIDLLEHLGNIKAAKESLLDKVGITRKELMSNIKFAKVLIALGVTPPTKISKTTGKVTSAFAKSDEKFKELLNHSNPDVQALVAARLGVKSTLEETRTQRFIGIAGRGLMPVPLRYYAAHTGRWGGDDKLNLQNIPRTSLIKKALLAPEGYVLVDADSSQIEARTLAWFAGQEDLVDAFTNNEDVYRMMAAKIYHIFPISRVSTEQRFVGKIAVLGCGYGMGADKFQAMLHSYGVHMTLTQAEEIIYIYRRANAKIKDLWDAAQHAIKTMTENKTCSLGKDGVLEVYGLQGIKLPNGLFLKYPNLRSMVDEKKNQYVYAYDNKRGAQVVTTHIYGGKLVENICQALARIAIGDQMRQVAKKIPVVLTVHDAIACIVPEDKWAESMRFISDCMRTAPAWAEGLPFNCEVGYGKNYSDSGKKQTIEAWGL